MASFALTLPPALSGPVRRRLVAAPHRVSMRRARPLEYLSADLLQHLAQFLPHALWVLASVSRRLRALIHERCLTQGWTRLPDWPVLRLTRTLLPLLETGAHGYFVHVLLPRLLLPYHTAAELRLVRLRENETRQRRRQRALQPAEAPAPRAWRAVADAPPPPEAVVLAAEAPPGPVRRARARAALSRAPALHMAPPVQLHLVQAKAAPASLRLRRLVADVLRAVVETRTATVQGLWLDEAFLTSRVRVLLTALAPLREFALFGRFRDCVLAPPAFTDWLVTDAADVDVLDAVSPHEIETAQASLLCNRSFTRELRTLHLVGLCFQRYDARRVGLQLLAPLLPQLEALEVTRCSHARVVCPELLRGAPALRTLEYLACDPIAYFQDPELHSASTVDLNVLQRQPARPALDAFNTQVRDTHGVVCYLDAAHSPALAALPADRLPVVAAEACRGAQLPYQEVRALAQLKHLACEVSDPIADMETALRQLWPGFLFAKHRTALLEQSFASRPLSSVAPGPRALLPVPQLKSLTLLDPALLRLPFDRLTHAAGGGGGGALALETLFLRVAPSSFELAPLLRGVDWATLAPRLRHVVLELAGVVGCPGSTCSRCVGTLATERYHNLQLFMRLPPECVLHLVRPADALHAHPLGVVCTPGCARRAQACAVPADLPVCWRRRYRSQASGSEVTVVAHAGPLVGDPPTAPGAESRCACCRRTRRVYNLDTTEGGIALVAAEHRYTHWALRAVCDARASPTAGLVPASCGVPPPAAPDGAVALVRARLAATDAALRPLNWLTRHVCAHLPLVWWVLAEGVTGCAHGRDCVLDAAAAGARMLCAVYPELAATVPRAAAALALWETVPAALRGRLPVQRRLAATRPAAEALLARAQAGPLAVPPQGQTGLDLAAAVGLPLRLLGDLFQAHALQWTRPALVAAEQALVDLAATSPHAAAQTPLCLHHRTLACKVDDTLLRWHNPLQTLFYGVGDAH